MYGGGTHFFVAFRFQTFPFSELAKTFSISQPTCTCSREHVQDTNYVIV